MAEEEVQVPPPSLLLAFTEAHRAAVEVLSLTITRGALEKMSPEGDGHPVMLLPGFMGGDGYNSALRRFLKKRNYAVYGWGLGRNLGPRDGVLEALEERLIELYEDHGEPLSLVGHSLGGIFARELAREYPEMVRQVISLGSPFGEGRMSGSIPARLFSALNPPEELPIDEDQLADAPPVPTTAIYSKGDGIVNWQTTYQKDGHAETQSIRVRGSHCGMTLNPSIWYLVAQCLATAPEEWQPFERGSWRNLVYPAAH
ncbi:MAG: pimeloyl-ACP methyl ester carboxylesterase [Halioglobus sp.]|jgi:pimeloyl-ACP methyl ester carboxylesterase